MSVASSLALGFSGFLLYNAEPGSTLFSYHPALMTIAYSLLVFEAVQIFNKSNPVRSWLPVRPVTFHWLLAGTSMICIGGGMYAVFTHKENLGKEHFVSLHSKLGLVANSGMFMTAIGGVLTLYRRNLSLPPIVKTGHMVAGAVVYSCAVGALLTGLSSNWFSNVVMVNAPVYWKVIFSLPVVCGFVVVTQVVIKVLKKPRGGSDSTKSK